MNKQLRFVLLMELMMIEATTIKGTDVIAFKIKQHFNSLFKEIRKLSLEFDKVAKRHNAYEQVDNMSADLYDCFDIIVSTDIKKSLTVQGFLTRFSNFKLLLSALQQSNWLHNQYFSDSDQLRTYDHCEPDKYHIYLSEYQPAQQLSRYS